MEEQVLLDWLDSETPLTKEMFDLFKELTRRISSSEQILFLKKVFNEIAKGNIILSISDITEIKTYSLEFFQEIGEPEKIDYRLDLIIHTLNSIHKSQNFSFDSKGVFNLIRSISDFICNYLQNNINYLTKIDLLFDKCIGRESLVSKLPSEEYLQMDGNNYKIYISRLTRNKWIYLNGEYLAVNLIYDEKLLQQLCEDNENNYYDYFQDQSGCINECKFLSDSNSYIITPDSAPVHYCEGRKSPVVCDITGKEFWWCYGRRCFKSNQNEHNTNDWKDYSFRDFLKILKLPFDEIGYYIFVSEINRLNKIIERLKCNECNYILRPAKQSHFGFYRVSHFHCNNVNCSSFHKEIYLTHCLNGRCGHTIDSRDTKKCSNSFYICPKCGGCCSNEQFSRRIRALKINGQPINEYLNELFNKNLGHWEKAECFCYKCQSEMKLDKNNIYICNKCNTKYNEHNLYIKFYKNYKLLIKEKKEKAENESKKVNLY